MLRWMSSDVGGVIRDVSSLISDVVGRDSRCFII
jgi:hypothetical protein